MTKAINLSTSPTFIPLYRSEEKNNAHCLFFIILNFAAVTVEEAPTFCPSKNGSIHTFFAELPAGPPLSADATLPSARPRQHSWHPDAAVGLQPPRAERVPPAHPGG